MAKLFAAFIFILTSQIAVAQEFNFKTYSLPEGLGQAQVTDMVEDQYGQIWFATFGGGVSMFNGQNFITYTANNGLCGNFSNCVSAKGDSVFVGGDEGLSIISPKGIFTFTTNHGLRSDTVIVVKWINNQLWVGTPKGIQLADFRGSPIFHEPTSILQRSVTFIEPNNAGNVWVGYTHYGIREISKELEVLQTFSKENGNLVSSEVRCLAEKGDMIAVGTYGAGIQIINGTKSEVLNSKNNFDSDIILHLRFEDNQLWVATQTKGVLVLDASTFRIQKSISQRNLLPSNQIMKTIKDQWGNHWFSTRGRGAARHFAPEIVHYTKRSGLPNETVLCTYQLPDSSILISTKDGQLLKYENDSLFNLDELEKRIEKNVRCFLADTSGAIWIGTDGNGLFKWTKDSLISFGREQGLTYRWIKDLALDNQGAIWLGTLGGGIYRFANNKFESGKALFGFDAERAECLQIDNEGTLWVGTRKNGLFQIKNGTLAKVQHQIMSKSAIRDITADKANQIWVATSKGIFKLNGNEVLHITTDYGLNSANVFSCLASPKYVFFGTDRGIAQIDQENAKVVYNYGYEQGFTGIEAMQNALMLDYNNRLWCGTVSTLSIIDFEKRRPINRTTIPVFNRAFMFENQLTDSLLKTYEKNDGYWSFEHDQNAFTFEFSGINQFEPDAVIFKWQLVGYEDEMSLPQKIGRVSYSHLPAGSYTFQFATGANGVWSKPKTAFRFIVHQPFWRTTWFLLLMMLMAGLVVSSLLYLRIRNIRARSSRENEQLRLKNELLELEAKALQLQMNPHFMFNALNSVKGLIAVNDLKSAKLYLARFAKLMRRILENSRDPFVSLESELDMMEIYLQLENQALEKTFQFEILVDEDIDTAETFIPPMILQPFMENAVKHAMRYKSGDGKIELLVHQQNGNIQCEIVDNGPGRSAVREKQLAEQKHRSMALEITTERLKSFGREFGVEIQDIELNGESAGTRVVLSMPSKHE
ncbi:MAG: histidine kinase [Bacteroidetes bacterium]|nr:histidine kinase [Bacteroidota bacterium]